MDGIPEPLKITLAGTDYDLRRLSIYDRGNLLRAARKQQKDELRQNLKDAGIGPEETFATLSDFDREGTKDQAWVDFCNDPLNDYDIYVCALQPAVDEAKARELAKMVEADFEQKVKLAGLTIVTTPRDGAGTGNPPIPPTYSRPAEQETGSPTAAE